MTIAQKTPKLLYLSYALAMAVLFILVYGYQFNTGDQTEHLPQVYRLFDSSLYPNDFFLKQYDQTFTVRFFWIYLVYGISQIFGVATTCFILFFACTTLTILAWMRITQVLTENNFASWIAPLLFLFVFRNFTVGGNTLLGTLFVGSSVAEPLASWGFYYWLKHQKIKGSILLGLACWFQLLVGLQLFILLSLLHLIGDRNIKSYSRYLLYFIVFIGVSAPMLLPLLWRQSFHTQKAADLGLFYHTLFVQRAPWHYLPSLFPMMDYVKLAGLLVLGIITLKFQRPNARLFAMNTLGVLIIAGCIIYFLLVEVFQLHAFGKFQWFKTTVWLNLLLCISISGYLSRFKPNIILTQKLAQKANIILLGMVIVGLLVVTHSLYLPFKGRYHIGNYIESNQEKIHDWISKETPKDALFVCPPDDESFTCEAKRSTPVNFKAVIHEPFYFVNWCNTVSAYYQVDFKQVDETNLKSTAMKGFYSNPLPATLPADYVVYEKDLVQFAIDTNVIVHQEGNWIVLQLK